MGLSVVDWLIALASVIAVLLVGIFSTHRKNNNVATSPTDFFLAGRNMKWWISAASLFASNIGTEHFVGQAGLAATTGMAVVLYEWTAIYYLICLAWIFAPVYLRCRLKTIPEYLELRFDKRSRYWFVMITLVAYALTKLGSSLFSGAVVLEVLLGMNLWTSAPVILILTAIYTTFGGLIAVMFTDTLQSAIFLIGGFIGGLIALNKVGGISEMKDVFKERDMKWFLHNVHPLNDQDFPWLGLFVGLGLIDITYWCIDQEMAQRVLASKSLDHAQLGTMAAASLKLTPILITVLPGMVARALYEKCLMSEEADFTQWCVNGAEDMSDSSDSNKAYPLLVLREFPTGVKGIMVAAFLSAMMSSLSSVFNSASTIFTYDVYLRVFHPDGEVPPQIVVLVGRITTIVVTILGILWLPVIQHSNDGVYLVTLNATAHLLPPVTAVFLAGLFWPRANGQGAFASFVVGSILGIIRLVLSVVFQDYCDDHSYEEDGRNVMRYTAKTFFLCLNFLIFAIFLFIFCLIIIVVVSLLSESPNSETIEAYLFQWPSWEQKRKETTSIDLEYRKECQADEIQEQSTLLNSHNNEESCDEEKEWMSSKVRTTVARFLGVFLFCFVSLLIGLTR